MARRPQDVTDAEREVLRALWEQGPATIRALADELYPGGSTSEYATVQKLLERLSDKGHVSRRADGRHCSSRSSAGAPVPSYLRAKCKRSGASIERPCRPRPVFPSRENERR